MNTNKLDRYEVRTIHTLDRVASLVVWDSVIKLDLKSKYTTKRWIRVKQEGLERKVKSWS